jgi:broad specificity phosphatase PhoE
MPGTPQYLVLLRHGQSEANEALEAGEDGLHYKVTGSDREVALTELGAAQALEAGKQLARLFPSNLPINIAWLSPFCRIRQTLEQVELALGYQVQRAEDERLAKRNYGLFWNLTYKGVAVLFPEEHARFLELGHLHYRPPEGENYFDLFARIEEFIGSELDRAQGNLLICAHSVVCLAFQRVFEKLPDQEVVRLYEESALPNGHLRIYMRQAPGQAWLPVALIDELVA